MCTCFCVCVCVCVGSADTCVYDGGADTSDRGVVLLLKSCRWLLTFEEASKERRGGQEMEHRTNRKGEKEKRVKKKGKKVRGE